MFKIFFPIMLFCYMFIGPFLTADLDEHRTLHYNDDVQITVTVVAVKRPTEMVIPDKTNGFVHNINESVSLEEPHVILQENRQSKQERFQLPVQYQSSYLSTLLI